MAVIDLYRQAYEDEHADRLRSLPTYSGNRQYHDFSTNDYLGLSREPLLLQAACRAAVRYGLGATGSRLLSGNTPLHQVLERRIARDLGTEAALLFPSGYQLNVAVLSSLLTLRGGGEAAVFTDRLIHASLHHGASLAGIREQRYRHNDLVHLEQLLQTHHARTPRIIVTESVFGMDGDVCDIVQLRALAHKYDALLYLDEAHAVGVYGHHGYGLTDEENVYGQAESCEKNLLIVGTLSKALGSSGAYIACSQAIKNYLIQKCGGFIYSTALAPPLVAGAWAAWHLLPTLKQQRLDLQVLADRLRAGLAQLGLDHGASTSHILPIILQSEKATLHAQASLCAENIIVSAIRPPTVPLGQARLRIALRADHTEAHILHLLRVLQRLA